MDLTDRLNESLAPTYRVERELGGGGMSRVFLATEITLGRSVVIKVLPPDMSTAFLAERFRREITLAAKLRHPNIVPLLAAGDAAGLLYYTMPFVEGETLRERIVPGRAVPVPEALHILRDIADALSYAHRHNVVHRDIKPDNVLLEHGHAVVADFGVAKALANASQTVTPATADISTVGVTFGTVAYMAPEQAAADPAIDHRADLYSLGVLAYELLTGATPFSGRTPHQTITAHMVETPQPIAIQCPDLPPAVADLVMRLLAKHPDRPGSAADVVNTLEGLARTVAPGIAELGPGQIVESGSRVAGSGMTTPHRYRAALAFGGVIALTVAAYGIPLLVRRGDGDGDGITTLTSASVPRAEARSVAVLPFDNTDRDAENEHFSEGLTDELIGALGKVRGLKVAARTSTFALKGKGLGVRAIGDTLGVAAVLEGSVRRSGNRLKVTVRLVDVADGGAIWSEVYDRQMKDVFSVQEEIARAIVAALDLSLTGDERGRLASAPTRDLEAYELYLKGRYNWNQRTRQNMETAIAYFDQAVQRDPKFALAYAGMASAYLNMSNYGYLPTGEAFGRARAAVDQAIALDPSLAEAQAARGFLLASSGDFVASEAAFRTAIQLNASYPPAHHFYSLLLIMLGRADDASRENIRALALDPLFRPANSGRGIILGLKRDFAGARRELQRSLKLAPNSATALYFLGLIEAHQGRYLEALTLLKRAHEEAPGFPGVKPALAFTLARLGRREESDSIVGELRADAKDGRTRINLALAEALMGDLDAAFAKLGPAGWDVPTLVELRTNPLLGPFRGDPRYARLLASLGLTP